MRSFVDLAEKLKMDVADLIKQCNGKIPPSKAVVKGLAKELDIDESFLNRLADEVRKDLGYRRGRFICIRGRFICIRGRFICIRGS
jgi:transcriptional regulator with XRE-family HTH domain